MPGYPSSASIDQFEIRPVAFLGNLPCLGGES
jgi:hypothetical protein